MINKPMNAEKRSIRRNPVARVSFCDIIGPMNKKKPTRELMIPIAKATDRTTSARRETNAIADVKRNRIKRSIISVG